MVLEDHFLGGIHWLKLSRMTLKQFEGFNRYNLFVRNPWDPQSSDIMGRYSDYYERGSIVQDVRWGNQAFQGFALDGAELPGDVNFTFLYGKSQTSASYFEEIDSENYQQSIQFANTQFYSSFLPSYILGGRLSKTVEQLNLGLNSLNGYSYRDSIGLEINNYQVHSLDYDFTKHGFSFIGEIGIGKYNDLDRGLAIISKMKTPKKYIFLPFDIEYFRVSSNFYNNNSEILNSSINDGISADLEIRNTKTNNVSTFKISDGKYAAAITIIDDEDFVVTVKKKDYSFNSTFVSSSDSVFQSPSELNFNLEKISKGSSFLINDINFELDSYEINDQSSQILYEFANYLKLNSNIIISINGYTDSIGESSYNVQLSQERAKSVYNKIISLGISEKRLNYKGYGEENLKYQENKTNFKLNRRTEFEIINY